MIFLFFSFQDWGTIDPDTYGFSTNGGTRHDIQFNIDNGNYNMMLIDCPLFDVTKETNKSSHDLFKTCFPDGFAWELMDILSGLCFILYNYRHTIIICLFFLYLFVIYFV